MGIINHNSIIITTSKGDFAEGLFDRIVDISGNYCGTVSITENNFGYATIFISPDGSKEGWEDSDIGDDIREKIKKILHGHGSETSWVEVSFGELGQRIVDGNNKSEY